MSTGLTLALIFLVLAVAVQARQALRMWRGEDAVARRMQVGLTAAPLSPEVKRGIVRGVVAQLLQLSFIVVAVLAGVAAKDGWHGGSKITVLSVAAVASLVAMMVCFGLQVAVIWFNKPGLIVPPYMREEPGVRASRQARRVDAAGLGGGD
jgi:hypothetical protein